MPNLASVSAVPLHSPVAQKAAKRASGKEDGASTGFRELVRGQAGPLQPVSPPKLLTSVADHPSGRAASSAREEVDTQSPVADQPHSSSSLNQPGATIAAGTKTAVTELHADAPNLLLTGHGGMNTPDAAAENISTPAKGSIFSPKQALAVESGKLKDRPHSDLVKEPEKKGKKVDSTIDRKGNPEIPGSLPVTGQALLSLLSPSSPPSPLSVEQTATANQSEGATGGLRGAPEPGDGADWLRSKELGRSVALPAGPGSGPTSPNGLIPEFDISRNDGVEAAKPSDETAPMKAVSSSLSQARRVDPEKPLFAAGATIAQPGTVAAHGSNGAPVYGPQHQAPSAPSGTASPTVSSSIVAAPNVYDKIDQGAAPVLLHSGAQHVSVGVHDPDLGWVEIQTQSAAGHVDATLVTSSGQSHASLAAQLPAMAQYLEQRDVRVGTLVVHHHAAGGGSSGAGSGGPGYGSAHTGAGAQHSNPRDSGGERASQPGRAAPGHPRSPSATGGRPSEEGGALRAVSYISVRV